MSRGCQWCEVRWPDAPEYRRCPRCREETAASFKRPSYARAEATNHKRHHDFGWWLWDTGRV